MNIPISWQSRPRSLHMEEWLQMDIHAQRRQGCLQLFTLNSRASLGKKVEAPSHRTCGAGASSQMNCNRGNEVDVGVCWCSTHICLRHIFYGVSKASQNCLECMLILDTPAYCGYMLIHGCMLRHSSLLWMHAHTWMHAKTLKPTVDACSYMDAC